jgi:hypothetical protein
LTWRWLESRSDRDRGDIGGKEDAAHFREGRESQAVSRSRAEDGSNKSVEWDGAALLPLLELKSLQAVPPLNLTFGEIQNTGDTMAGPDKQRRKELRRQYTHEALEYFRSAFYPNASTRHSLHSTNTGFATARLELSSGYPGYFYSPGDGGYIFAVDENYGLPIRKAGDHGDVDWICGFNRGVIAHVEEHGLPWNSWLSSLAILSDLPDYFRREASQAARLALKGTSFKPDGFGFALSLEDGSMGVSVQLETESLFEDPEIVIHAMMPYRITPPRACAPTGARLPSLRPGRRSIRLRYDDAQCVECVAGPLGSHLVVFRFSDFAPSPWGRREAKEVLLALDTHFADWVPRARSRPLLERRPQP